MTDGAQLDIVERLRDTPNWSKESYGDWKSATMTYDRTPFEAAELIVYMRKEGWDQFIEIRKLSTKFMVSVAVNGMFVIDLLWRAFA